MSEKIGEQHFARRAILYVRQSSAQQLAHNQESRRQQYAMRERLHALGWREVEVIDEDLGKSAAGTALRSGFSRLVAEVSLGHVGVVAAREVSRFARNSRDWQQLVEICRVVDTLLVDQETVYSPRLSNDRLLLGLKGTLNEYELDLLRLRGLEARREKAGRGELVIGVAVGYRLSDDGRIEKTPDMRVRQVIETIFSKFFELGSSRQVMLWLRAEKTQVAVNRDRHGNVEWKEPTQDYVYRTLTNPVYAGAYAYGRKKHRPRLIGGTLRPTTKRLRRCDWDVLLHDHHEAYISWQQFERVEQMLAMNAQKRGLQGAARCGCALLAGLIWCRRCGCRLGVNYSGRASASARYTCEKANLKNGDPKCLSFSSIDVDVQVARQLLDVVQPGAIEAARAASLSDAAARDRTVEAQELQSQQARYQALRAERQYNAVDPDNRTVASELERRWNTALEHARAIEQRLAEAQAARGLVCSNPPDVSRYLDLAHDLGRVWNADTTDMTLKKRIARTVIEQIWADVDETRGEIVLIVHWKGGAHTELRVRKRRSGENRRQTASDVVDAVRALACLLPDQQIASWLGRAGLRTPNGEHYTRALVASLRNSRGIEAYSEQRRVNEGWLTCEEVADLLRVDGKTVRRAAARKDLPASQPVPGGPWIFARNEIVGTAAAQRVMVRASAQRGHQGEGPAPDQLSLGIPNT